MVMQFWQPMWSELTVSKGNEKAKQLILEGRLEVINFSLQSIQYLGDENFYGEDAVRVSTMNRNGINDIEVPIFVEPINDPPFINVPEFIILEEKRDEEELLIFDKQRDEFNFTVGDPDLLFPGNDSHFLVMFSLEVDSGVISTNLRAELISTTELKLKSSYQWQPLQTFVTISKHFMVKAKGIRFRGAINECNSVMQQISYHGNEHDGAVLTVTINDMGKYGCFLDCDEMMSKPLFAKATINLMRRRPMSSLVAHTLGSAIVIEFIALFCLGVLLVLFICKCALVLIRERKRRYNDQVQNIELSSVQRSSKKTFCTDLSESVSHFTGCCSSPFLISGQHTNFRQRSGHRSGNAKFSKGLQSFSQSLSDHHRETLPGFLPAASGDGQRDTT